MEEISDVVQILNLGIEGMKFAIKGTVTTGKLAKKGIDVAALKKMQFKLKLHYASQGKNKTMLLKDLEKITGGDYRVMNIPTEEKQELMKFYDALKKLKVPFAELPDLNIGDGFTQIAYNPQDADKIRSFVENYEFPENKSAQESSLDEYMENAAPEEMAELDKTAIEAAKKEEQKEQSPSPNREEPEKEKTVKEKETGEGKSDEEKIKELSTTEKLKQRNKDENYIPVTIDKTMIVSENNDTYVTRVPSSYDNKSKSFLLFTFKKSDAVFVNDGQTLLTHLRKGSETHLACSKSGTGREKTMKNEDIYKSHYAKYRQKFDDDIFKNKVRISDKSKNTPAHQKNKVKM